MASSVKKTRRATPSNEVFRKQINAYKITIIEQATKIENAATVAIYEEGVDLFNASQLLAPVDTGRLRATATLTPVGATTVEVTYDTEYALFQHETENNKINGEYRYLAKPLEEISNGYRERVAARIKQLTGLK